MGELLKYIELIMNDLGHTRYSLRPELIQTAGKATTTVNGGSDLYVLASAFMQTTTPLNGQIFGANNAFDLIGVNLSTVLYKHQVFKENIRIFNSSDDLLYTEFIIVSPTP